MFSRPRMETAQVLIISRKDEEILIYSYNGVTHQWTWRMHPHMENINESHKHAAQQQKSQTEKNTYYGHIDVINTMYKIDN